jgi:hypothetical protein
VYVEQAISALKDASEKVEAIIVQPYRDDVGFTSTIEAMRLYRELNDGQSIPILFTPQGRMSEDGQFFEYGAQLLNVFSREDIALVKKNYEAGKWVLPLDDTWPPYGQNFLIVKIPIVRLPKKLPVSVAINILKGPRQGEPVQAISIPAPKRIEATYRDMLDIESFEKA